MKSFTMLILGIIGVFCAKAQVSKNMQQHHLPDSVKATALVAVVQAPAGLSKQTAGITANGVSLYIKTNHKKCRVYFEVAGQTGLYKGMFEPVVEGIGITGNDKGMAFDFVHDTPCAYKLLLASAGDSAENFTLYSGYIYFPTIQKWKLIATFKTPNRWATLQLPASFSTPARKNAAAFQVTNLWCQRSNGSWKALAPADIPPPVLLPFSNTDSAGQVAWDSAKLAGDIARGKTDVKYYKEGVYYTMLKEGNGKPVTVTDTISVFYKGYLYVNGKVFDETKEKPARFPLNRLIKGWQTGLPLCKVGGKIKLVILSGQAYSIRTRAAKIPPNSILVFEIEVVGAEDKGAGIGN